MYSLRGSWVFTEVKSKLTYIVIIINIKFFVLLIVVILVFLLLLLLLFILCFGDPCPVENMTQKYRYKHHRFGNG